MVFTAEMPVEPLAVMATWAPLTPVGIIVFSIACVVVIVSWVLQWRKMNKD